MSERQLDFFSDIGVGVEQGLSQGKGHALVSAEIDDERLIAAIPQSTLADSCSLAAEAGRRRLAGAIPALAALCRRFAGFGARRMVSEQVAAIEGLAMIGGRDAAKAVSEMIERAVVQGPTLQIAVSAAARLGSTLSPDALRQLLRHAEPGIRADACRCARPLPELILILVDLLVDLDRLRRSMQYRRLPMKNARFCSGGLLGRDRSWPTQRLSAWRTPTAPVPSPLRLRSGACGCHGRARAPALPMTTYCSNPAPPEIPKWGPSALFPAWLARAQL